MASMMILIMAFGLFAWQFSTAAAYMTAFLIAVFNSFFYQNGNEYFINTSQGRKLGYQAMGGYFNIICCIGMTTGTFTLGWLFNRGMQQGLWIMVAAVAFMLGLYCIINLFAGKVKSGRPDMDHQV
jgi:hypothetical protein